MQIDFREIVQNPINPRKISREGFERLKLSLIVFPKMLEIRPIVINEDKVILGGNMRHKALTEIYSMSAEDKRDFVKNTSEAEHPDLETSIDHWEKWRDNPLIKVGDAKLNEKEQKELIIKDNISYGTFEIAKLNDFSKEELMDLELYEEPSEFDIESRISGSSPKSMEKLQFGKYSVPMNLEDYDALLGVFDSYVKDQGTSFGFVTHLKENYENNRHNED